MRSAGKRQKAQTDAELTLQQSLSDQHSPHLKNGVGPIVSWEARPYRTFMCRPESLYRNTIVYCSLFGYLKTLRLSPLFHGAAGGVIESPAKRCGEEARRDHCRAERTHIWCVLAFSC